jgi:hypothetical protein
MKSIMTMLLVPAEVGLYRINFSYPHLQPAAGGKLLPSAQHRETESVLRGRGGPSWLPLDNGRHN